jgi:ribosomal protein S13
MKIYTINNIRYQHQVNNMMKSFLSIYGIGKIKAKRLIEYMMTKNRGTTRRRKNNRFKTNIVHLLYAKRRVFYHLFNRERLDKRLRYQSFISVKRKIEVYAYTAYRLFQRLPQKGQRTRANAHGPKHYNPFYVLGLHSAQLQRTLEFLYKRKELFLNRRQRQLREYIEKYKISKLKKVQKEAKKQKKKLAEQNFIKNFKTKDGKSNA